MKQKISFRFDWLTFNTDLVTEFFAPRIHEFYLGLKIFVYSWQKNNR